MKIFKNLFLLLIVFAFSVTLLIFLFNISLKSTLLSTSYFNKMIDESEISKVLVEAIKLPDSKSLYDEAWDNSKQAPLKATFVESIDKSFLEQQVLILLKGIDSYVLGSSNTLPVLDVSSLKKDFQQKVLIDFERVTKELSEQEKAGMLKILNQRLKMDNIKENFDLNELGAKLYPNSENPLSALRELVHSYSKTFITLIFLSVLLLVIIGVINNKIRPTLVWIGGGMLFSGIIVLLTGILAKVLNMFEVIPGLEEVAKNTASKTSIGYFMRDLFNNLLIGGIILTFAGTVLIITGMIAFNKKNQLLISKTNSIQSNLENDSQTALKKVDDNNQRLIISNKHQRIFRVIAVIILTAAIPTIILFGTNSFKVAITKFSESLESTSKFIDDTFADAAIQVSGATFLNEKFDPTYAITDSTKGYLVGILVELLDESGNPLRRVDIAIHKDSPDGPKLVIYGLVTRSNGKVNIFSVEKGTYYIEVLDNGKIPTNLRLPKNPTKVVAEGTEDIDVTITLKNK